MMPASKAANFIQELQQTYLLPTESRKPTGLPSDYLWGLRRERGLGLFPYNFHFSVLVEFLIMDMYFIF